MTPDLNLIEEAIASYERLRADWLAGLTPERLALIADASRSPYRPVKRCTIERERGSVVYRSQCPYVGVEKLIKGAK